jgi:hypothetical protein
VVEPESGEPEAEGPAQPRHFGEKAKFVRTLPCLVCGATPSQACHAKSRGAGGTSEHLVPMCPPHHREQHDVGIRTFEAAHGVDLMALAQDYHRAWLIRGGDAA